MTSFVIQRNTLNEKQVIDRAHPPVVRAVAVASSVTGFSGGELVTLNADREVTAWNGTAGTVFGVVSEKLDRPRETLARVLVHGTVFKKELTVNGKPISDAQLAELGQSGIWAN